MKQIQVEEREPLPCPVCGAGVSYVNGLNGWHCRRTCDGYLCALASGGDPWWPMMFPAKTQREAIESWNKAVLSWADPKAKAERIATKVRYANKVAEFWAELTKLSNRIGIAFTPWSDGYDLEETNGPGRYEDGTWTEDGE